MQPKLRQTVAALCFVCAVAFRQHAPSLCRRHRCCRGPPHTHTATALPPPVPSQIRTVDLGPFKHRIDDGLELRKAAFECLDILLASLPHVLQVGAALRGVGGRGGPRV